MEQKEMEVNLTSTLMSQQRRIWYSIWSLKPTVPYTWCRTICCVTEYFRGLPKI